MRHISCKDFGIEYTESEEYHAYVLVGFMPTIDENDRLVIESRDAIAVFKEDVNSVEEAMRKENPDVLWVIIPLFEYLDTLSREWDLETMLSRFMN